jgi:hypothetical protein
VGELVAVHEAAAALDAVFTSAAAADAAAVRGLIRRRWAELEGRGAGACTLPLLSST